MGSSLYLYRLLLLCCFFHLIILSNSSSSPPPLCHEDESSALLRFKHSFFINKSASSDPSAYPKVQSWRLEGKSSDCCSWDGVQCDHHTGHVIGLDLSSSFLYGSFNSNSSLFNLVHLRRLNLADNDFNYSQIPSKIAHLSRLRSLNLSYSLFYGQIPSEISNISKLVFLDLSMGWYYQQFLNLEKPNLGDLLKNLTNLKVIDLSGANISSTVTSDLSNMSSLTTLTLQGCRLYGEFPTSIFRLPNLQFLNVEDNENLTGCLPEFHRTSPLKALEIARTNFFGLLPDSIGNLESLSILALNECNFSGMLPASLGNLAQLNILYLGTNHFWGKIPSSLLNLTQLTHLQLCNNNFDVGTLLLILGKLSKLTYIDLEGMKIRGDIPQSLANMTQLSHLSLMSNELLGQIPSWLMNATQLIVLDLTFNQLQGKIPSSISQLEHLKYCSFAYNNLIEVKIDIFLKLLDLKKLYLSGNKLAVLSKNSTNSTLPKIKILGLRSCNLGEFPDFLRFQDELYVVTLSNNNIHGQIPTWFCNTSKETMEVLMLENNFLTGFEQHLDVIPWQSLTVLYLSFNRMQGSLPIPSPSLIHYGISANLLTGEIPPSFCQHNSIQILDLSNNNISGTIPQCLANFSDSLLVLNLSCNNFHGTIPQIFMKGNKLKLIDLSQNQLRRQVPRSLENCTLLEILVIRNNQIEDTFPFWLGALPQLKVLVLRSNSFHGAIGNHKTNLMFPLLRIIDLSHKGFSGTLPSDYFHNWNAMKMAKTETWTYMQETSSVSLIAEHWTYSFNYNYSVTLANKGTQRLYEHIQTAFVALDLSNNKFKGDIPESTGSLSGLQALNISNNNLTGVIPSSLANLTELESLDLSQNQLSGEIPQQLTKLNFLEFLNVSHNHLAGPIPHGNQFDTFENSSYYENSGLCGNPLSKLCGNSRSSPPPLSLSFQSDDSKFPRGVDWIVIFMGFGSGLIVGLVIGHALTTRYHEWFVMTFGKRNQTQRRKKGRRN